MRVLLADAGDATPLVHALAAEPGLSVLRRPLDQSLAEAVRVAEPDVLVLAMPGPEQVALDVLGQMAAAPCPVALFIGEDVPCFMQQAIDAGVSFYAVLGRKLPAMTPVLRVTIALFRRHRAMDMARMTAETRLAERIIIDRAKMTLMKHRRLSEANAYRWLRRQAMDRGRRIVDIAETVLTEGLG